MRLVVLFLALLVATAAYPQTANVIDLEPEDSAAALKAWLNLQDAQAKWDNEKSQIESKYVYHALSCWQGPTVPSGAVCSGNGSAKREGFQSGFEFSKNFKYIVPVPPPTVNYNGNPIVGVAW